MFPQLRSAVLGFALPLAALASGCASARPVDANAVHAQCPVCTCEGDLACVDVVVTASTPHCECNGTTWYFCSEECMHTFTNAPQDYLPPRP